MTYESKLEKIDRKVTELLAKDANFAKKAAIYGGAVCTALAIGHAVDSAKWSEA